MQLETFNQLASSQARLVLQACAHIPTWVSELIQKRPYSSKEQLYQAADEQAATWQWSEISEALAKHPRIGEKKQRQFCLEKNSSSPNVNKQR